MHVVKGEIINIVDGRFKDRNGQERQYRELQIFADNSAPLVHRLKGKILGVIRDEVNGRACQVIRILESAGDWKKVTVLLDYDLDRKHRAGGDSEFYCTPYVYGNGGRAFVDYTLTEDQTGFPEVNVANARLQNIRDYNCHDWQEGVVELLVRPQPWVSKDGNACGLNYVIAS